MKSIVVMVETIGIIIGVLATIGSGIYFAIKCLQPVAVDKYHLSQLESGVEKLYSRIMDIKSDVTDVKSELTVIKYFLVQKYPKNSYLMTVKKSPRTLNELGNRIFEQIKGEDFLNRNKEFFFPLIDKFHPETSLDVENATDYVCSAFTDNDIFNKIKLFVYNAPSLTVRNKNGEEVAYDLSLGDVCDVLSIPLRDMYLHEHPDIPQ